MEDQYTQAYEDELFGDDSSVQSDEVQDEELGFDETAVNPDDGDHDPEDWTSNSSEPDTEDAMTAYLRARGIDKSRIRTVDENGAAIEADFDDLSEQEKLDILNSAEDSPISDDEIQTINYLRQNRMNLKDFANWQRQQAVSDYLAQNQDVSFTVDELSDDDLYRFDLMDKFPDMTDEELDYEVESAKNNPDLFDKKITALRNEYAALEAQQQQEAVQQAEAAKQQQYDTLAQDIITVANNTNELNGLELEPEDKEEIVHLLLDRDANGQSAFYKLFEDPQAVFELAWYAKFGRPAFTAINDYYKGVIERSRRGSAPQQPRVVNRKSNRSKEPDPYGLNDVFK